MSERVGVRGRQGRTAPFGAWERDGWLAVDLADCLNRFATQFTWDQQKLKYVHCRVGQIKASDTVYYIILYYTIYRNRPAINTSTNCSWHPSETANSKMSNRELQLNSGMKCAKYMLIIVSFMFAVSRWSLILDPGSWSSINSTHESLFRHLGLFSIFCDCLFLSHRAPSLIIRRGKRVWV